MDERLEDRFIKIGTGTSLERDQLATKFGSTMMVCKNRKEEIIEGGS